MVDVLTRPVLPSVAPRRTQPAVPWAIGSAAALVAVTVSVAAGSIDLAVYLRAAGEIAAGRDPNITPSGELPWLYPPVAALAHLPLVGFPTWLAQAVVALVSLAALARLLHLTLGRLAPGLAGPRLVALATAAALATEPVIATLGFGQVNLVVAWLVAEGLLGRQRWLIGVAAGIKLTPLVFLLPLVLRRDWKGAALTLAGFAATVAVGWLAAPAASVTYWGGLFFDPRDKIGIGYHTNQSLTGALWRTFGEGGSPLLWSALVAATLALTIVALRRRLHDDVAALWLTGLAGLLVAPIAWTHHWVWLLPAVGWLWLNGRRWLAVTWGVLLVGWVTWWLPGLGSAWTVVALATLVALSVKGDRR